MPWEKKETRDSTEFVEADGAGLAVLAAEEVDAPDAMGITLSTPGGGAVVFPMRIDEALDFAAEMNRMAALLLRGEDPNEHAAGH